jgi:RNA polymerase sigma-70 factor (ECF subfamily)
VDGARARFWAGLGGVRRTDLGSLPGWESRLDAALDEAARTWRADWLTREEFAGELASRLNEDDESAARWWDHLRPGDLYLTCACARRVAGALEKFERLFGAELARIAHRFERPGLPADDLIQLLRAKLFTTPSRSAPQARSTTTFFEDNSCAAGDGGRAPDARPRIAMYTGQGFLQNWLRVTATRTFIDCGRVNPELPEIPIRNELVAVLPEPKGDPELALLKREHMTHFKASFAEAVAALDAADRLLLKQHLVERLTIDQLGALYHLHRASAARRIAKARDALLVATRIALARRLGLPPERLASVLELVASRLEASIERLLG